MTGEELGTPQRVGVLLSDTLALSADSSDANEFGTPSCPEIEQIATGFGGGSDDAVEVDAAGRHRRWHQPCHRDEWIGGVAGVAAARNWLLEEENELPGRALLPRGVGPTSR